MTGFTVEVLCVGNELLLGRTIDSNSNYICRRVYELGGTARRVTIVPDDVEEIAKALTEISSRGTDWAIVTGGLGPTYDDKTLQGLAAAMKVPMSLSSKALEYINESVRRRAMATGINYPATEQMLKAREKMGIIPEGSEPLPNPVGTAPAVLARVHNTRVVCLPGVPAEMKAIFDQSVVPMLTSAAPSAYTVDIDVVGVPEAALAPLLESTAKEYPDFYIKSHPATAEKQSRVIIQITGRGADSAKRTEEVARIFTKWLESQRASFRLNRSTDTGQTVSQRFEDSHHSR